MNKTLSRSLAAGTALVLVLGFAPISVFAHGNSHDETAVTTTSIQEGEQDDENQTADPDLKTRLQELRQSRQENRQHRLEANKLRVCENRKARIAAIMTRSVNRAEKQIELFSTIAERVKAFYAKKGRTVASYDTMVAAVDAAKAKAQADLETLKTVDSFDCSADDPKGDAEAFKLALKTINQDLKDYRTSVKNLIVAVKSAQSTAAKEQEGGEE